MNVIDIYVIYYISINFFLVLLRRLYIFLGCFFLLLLLLLKLLRRLRKLLRGLLNLLRFLDGFFLFFLYFVGILLLLEKVRLLIG